jgi:hypothetical protein
LYQLVVIVGGDHHLFQAAVSAQRRIYKYFKQGFAVGDVRPFNNQQIGPMKAIMARTRYLMPAEGNVWPLVTDHLNSSIDPDGTLRAHINNGRYVFTDDNLVMYSEAVDSGIHEGYVRDCSLRFRL